MPTMLQTTSSQDRAFCAMPIRRDVKSPPVRTSEGADAPPDDFKAALKTASQSTADRTKGTNDTSDATPATEKGSEAVEPQDEAEAATEVNAEVDPDMVAAEVMPSADATDHTAQAAANDEAPAVVAGNANVEAITNADESATPAQATTHATQAVNTPRAHAEGGNAPVPMHGTDGSAPPAKPEAQANGPIALPETDQKQAAPAAPRGAEAGAADHLHANRPVTEVAGVPADGEGSADDPSGNNTRSQGQLMANQPAQVTPEAAAEPAPDTVASANRPATLPATEAVSSNQPAPAADAPAATQQRPMQAMQPLGLSAAQGRPAEPARLPEQNVDAVVAAARVGLSGGKQQYTMMLRLDPPQLGSMRLNVRMVEGQLTATFSTSSDVAHQMLQQSLGQLRAGLENAGFQVDRLQVQRTNPEQGGLSQQQGGGGDAREQMQQQHRDHQRRETLTRLWRSGWFEESGLNTTA